MAGWFLLLTIFCINILIHFYFNRFIRNLTLTRFEIKFKTISTTYLRHIIVDDPFKLQVFLYSQVIEVAYYVPSPPPHKENPGSAHDLCSSKPSLGKL